MWTTSVYLFRYIFFAILGKVIFFNLLLFLVSRRYGRPVIFIRNQEVTNKVTTKLESEDDEMEIDEPAQKKTRQ